MRVLFLLATLALVSCDENPGPLWKVNSDGQTVFWEEHGLVTTGHRTQKYVEDSLGWEVARLALKIQSEHGINAHAIIDKSKTVKWYLIDDIYYRQEFAGAIVLGYFHTAGPSNTYGALAYAISQAPWTVHQDQFTDQWFAGVETPQPYPRLEKVLIDLASQP